MKRLLPFAALLLFACSAPGAATSPSPSPEETESSPSTILPPSGSLALDQQSCPEASAHVYNPRRLFLLAGCRQVTVKGVIQSFRAEPDGDFHIRLLIDATQIDPKGGRYINPENTRQQRGALVLEPVCEQPVTQRDAITACQGYHNSLKVLAPPSHVAATGFWVFDSSHGWNELHPLTKLERTP